jgi:hypothetical protein
MESTQTKLSLYQKENLRWRKKAGLCSLYESSNYSHISSVNSCFPSDASPPAHPFLRKIEYRHSTRDHTSLSEKRNHMTKRKCGGFFCYSLSAA